MKNQWPIWMFVVAVVVIVLFAFNRHGGDQVVPLSDIFPDEQASNDNNIEYIFVDEPDKNTGAVAKTSEMKEQADLGGNAPAASSQTAMASPSQSQTSSAVKTANPMSQTASVSSGSGDMSDFDQVPFTIQVSSFKDRERAEEALKKVISSGHPGYIASADLGTKGVWYRIYVGRFATKSQAVQYLSNVQKNYSGSFVVSPKN